MAVSERIRQIASDPFVVKVGAWFLIGGLAVEASFLFDISFSVEQIQRLFAPKVPFLGLIIAAGTFQYSVWQRMADREVQSIADPQWAYVERQVGLGTYPEHAREAAKAALKNWHRGNVERANKMLTDILPHNTAILANYLFIGTCLLISVAADVVSFLIARDLPWARRVSTALFVIILLPFTANAVRYFLALWFEFRGYREWFEERRATSEEAAE